MAEEKEKSYWKLTSGEKQLWLSKRGLTKFNDVILPILTPMAGVVIMLLGLVLLILTLTAKSGVLTNNRPLMAAACGVVMAIGLGVAIWLLIDMKKKKKGFFINQYYAGDKSGAERQNEEIDQERAATDGQTDELSADLEF